MGDTNTRAAQERFEFQKFRERMHRHIDDAQRLADRNANGMACHLFAEHDKREFDRVFALSALDGDGDAKLRQLRDWLHREWLACIEAKKAYPVNTPERREMQAEANAIQRACFEADRLLAKPEQPAAEKPAAAPASDAIEAWEDQCEESLKNRNITGDLATLGALMTGGRIMRDLAARASQAEAERDRLIQAASDLSDAKAKQEEEIAGLRAKLTKAEAEIASRVHGTGGVYDLRAKLAEAERMESEWPEQIAAALGSTPDKTGRTPSMLAGCVDRLRAKLAEAEKQRDSNAVAAKMLERWRERRARCLEGVAPTLAEIQSEMTPWTHEVVAQKSAPAGSAMRRAIDAGEHIIGLLWKHSESLRERFDAEMEKANAERDAAVAAKNERANWALSKDAARLALWQAIEETSKMANATDDKVILDKLAAKGIYLCRAESPAPQPAVVDAQAREGDDLLRDWLNTGANKTVRDLVLRELCCRALAKEPKP